MIPLLLDSLNPNAKRPLIATGANKKIRTYACGITPYTLDSHMGHARNYVATDILLSILKKFFGYDIFHVMNVTDIDDNTYRATRRKRLFEEHKMSLQELKDILLEKKQVMDENLSLDDNLALPHVKDLVQDYLELKFPPTDASPSDFKAVQDFVRVNEVRFHEDMKALGVEPPSCLTRVTEHIPEIVAFVTEIFKKGFAYVGKNTGSIYFDTAQFTASGGNTEKLYHIPCGGDQDLKDEDEISSEKKLVVDFALLKKPKLGDLFYDTPWGKLKPGWHIECTAMASHTLFREDNKSTTFDIHFGGEDLKMHHKAEMLQADAVYGHTRPWVNHFLHIGHLNIAGLKMSKSLKNFITIRDALKHYSGRQLRLFFLMHPWHAKINYSDDSMKEVLSMEAYFIEFYHNLVAKMNTGVKDTATNSMRWTDTDWAMEKKLVEIKEAVQTHLMDNLNHVEALHTLKSLVGFTNVYFAPGKPHNWTLLDRIKKYLDEMFNVFGLSFAPPITSNNAVDKTQVDKLIDILASFRSQVRSMVLHSEKESIMKQCDFLRDETFVKLGLRLEDLPDGTFSIKPLSEEIKTKTKKLTSLLAQREKDIRKWLNMELSIKNWFLSLDKYDIATTYDEKNDCPTSDKSGKPLSKSAIKVMQKERANFFTTKAEYVKHLTKDPEFLNKQKEEITKLKAMYQ